MSIPEIECADESVVAVEELFHNDAHDGIIIASSKRRIRMSNDCASDLTKIRNDILRERVIDPTVQVQVIV